jgi:outer membrane protein assembly factor BamB
MLVVKLGGNGVLDETSIAWTMTKTYSNKPSVTLVGDLLFVINDLGIASCVDATSGENIWTHRLGGNFSSSPIVSGGRIYVGNEEGKFYVFEASREFKLLAENQFSDGFMASPAVDNQSLYLRSRTHLYRIEK